MPWVRIADDALNVPWGAQADYTSINKFGSYDDVQDGTMTAVWDGGVTPVYPFPASALITSVSQTVDQVAMRGGHIEVQGLDNDFKPVTQTVPLDASATTTPVVFTDAGGVALRRVFRMKVMEDVVSTSPIRAHNVGETVDYAIIQTGLNQTLMAVYTVPADKTAYMTSYYCDYVRTSVKDPDSIMYMLWVADNTGPYAKQAKHMKGIPKQAGGFQHVFNPNFKITEKSDVFITATPDGADAHVHAGFDLILVNN